MNYKLQNKHENTREGRATSARTLGRCLKVGQYNLTVRIQEIPIIMFFFFFVDDGNFPINIRWPCDNADLVVWEFKISVSLFDRCIIIYSHIGSHIVQLNLTNISWPGDLFETLFIFRVSVYVFGKLLFYIMSFDIQYPYKSYSCTQHVCRRIIFFNCFLSSFIFIFYVV